MSLLSVADSPGRPPGEIVDGTDDDLLLGDMAGVLEDGDAEVAELDRPVLGQIDVLRLDVPVDDPVLMGVHDGGAELVHDVAGFQEGELSPDVEDLLEGLTVDELVDDIGQSPIRPDVEDLDDVLVVETGRGSGLPFETGEIGLVGSRLLAHHLDGDVLVGDEIVRPVDDGHAPRAELREDLVPVVYDLVCPVVLVHQKFSHKETAILSVPPVEQGLVDELLCQDRRLLHRGEDLGDPVLADGIVEAVGAEQEDVVVLLLDDPFLDLVEIGIDADGIDEKIPLGMGAHLALGDLAVSKRSST